MVTKNTKASKNTNVNNTSDNVTVNNTNDVKNADVSIIDQIKSLSVFQNDQDLKILAFSLKLKTENISYKTFKDIIEINSSIELNSYVTSSISALLKCNDKIIQIVRDYRDQITNNASWKSLITAVKSLKSDLTNGRITFNSGLFGAEYSKEYQIQLDAEFERKTLEAYNKSVDTLINFGVERAVAEKIAQSKLSDDKKIIIAKQAAEEQSILAKRAATLAAKKAAKEQANTIAQ